MCSCSSSKDVGFNPLQRSATTVKQRLLRWCQVTLKDYQVIVKIYCWVCFAGHELIHSFHLSHNYWFFDVSLLFQIKFKMTVRLFLQNSSTISLCSFSPSCFLEDKYRTLISYCSSMEMGMSGLFLDNVESSSRIWFAV